MEEMIDITVSKDKKIKMIKLVSQEINGALSKVTPPFNDKRDILKLGKCTGVSNRIKLTYEILRDAQKSKTEQNRSPYREKGLIMQVSRNS